MYLNEYLAPTGIASTLLGVVINTEMTEKDWKDTEKDRKDTKKDRKDPEKNY